MLTANPQESVGEFLTREAAVLAAKEYIQEKHLQGVGAPVQSRDLPAAPDGGAPGLGAMKVGVPGPPERRHMRRVPVVQHIPAQVHGTFALRLVDLSLGGARIEHLGQLRPGFPCALEFPPPVGPLSLATHVVRSNVVSNRQRVRADRHFRYESGLAFADVTSEQEAVLVRILEVVSRSN